MIQPKDLSFSGKESSNSYHRHGTLISFNARRRAMFAPSSYRSLGKLTTGTVSASRMGKRLATIKQPGHLV